MLDPDTQRLVGTTNGLALFLRSFVGVVGAAWCALFVIALLQKRSIRLRDEEALLALLACAVLASFRAAAESRRRWALRQALDDEDGGGDLPELP